MTITWPHTSNILRLCTKKVIFFLSSCWSKGINGRFSYTPESTYSHQLCIFCYNPGIYIPRSCLVSAFSRYGSEILFSVLTFISGLNIPATLWYVEAVSVVCVLGLLNRIYIYTCTAVAAFSVTLGVQIKLGCVWYYASAHTHVSAVAWAWAIQKQS